MGKHSIKKKEERRKHPARSKSLKLRFHWCDPRQLWDKDPGYSQLAGRSHEIERSAHATKIVMMDDESSGGYRCANLPTLSY
jgi:hypothetical protein